MNELINKLEKKKERNNDEDLELKNNKKEKYKYYIGKNYTKELNIPYLEFSHKTNKLYIENEEIKSTKQFLKSFWPITNKLDNINYIDTEKQFSNIFKENISILKKIFPDKKNISHFNIIKELKDYNQIKENISLLLFVIISFKEKLIIIFKKEVKEQSIYLEYQNQKFIEIKSNIVNNLINNNKNEFHIYLCEKIFYNENVFLETYIGKKASNLNNKKPEKKIKKYN